MGILAIAGAAAGAGQGITQAGEQAQKMDMASKVNELAQKREEAIERLRASTQQSLQSSQQGFEAAQTQTRITAASKAAGVTREFEQSENTKNRASREQIGKGHDIARVDAAKESASVRAEAKGPAKIWEAVKLPGNTVDPKTNMPLNTTTMVNYNHFTNRSYMQIGDKMVPFDATKNGPANDPKSITRAPAEETKDLLTHPLDLVPDGPNAGLSRADVFESAHGYLPTQWGAAAASKANPKQHPQLFSASSSGPSMAASKGNTDEGAADNQAQSDADQADQEPPFQSNAMSSYSANQ
jgi:hypothetical protein